jgi:hypothetical protein
MFVRYECGCVGFTPDENGDAVIVEACDREDDYIIFSQRNMKNNQGVIRGYKGFSEIGEGQLITKLQRAIADGYKFREIQRLLK